jgi:putative Mn2+ efflux pump MntP
MKKMSWKKAIIIGLYFGIFQMLMPIIGYLLGYGFSGFLEDIDHWIAFLLLAFIGLKMIKESFECKENSNDCIDFKTMFMLAIATSIDALAVGITYAFLDVANCLKSFTIIGIITFVLSVMGVEIGNKFGNKHGNKAELVGGAILICIGLRILLEHLNVV